MRENVKKQIRNAKKRRIRRRRFYAAVALCSILVAGIVSWKLILPGTAMSGETYCGKEEHTHSDACHEQVLICGQEEGAGAHTHTDACYTEVRTDQLICGQEESAGHVHTDACYTNELTCGQEENAEHTHTDACYTKTLTCGQEEGAGAHTHTDACYATERKLTCGQEEGAGHTHTDACYKTELTCDKEEHKHTSECYSNPDAVETEDQWKAAFKNYKLTGEWGKDTAAVAKSQVGYKESTENYKVNEDKSTDGYTRYADWAGDDIYGDWNTDFAAFCLNYAGVPADKFPVNADDLGAWITAMNNAGYYGDPDSAEPQPGDLIVLKKADQDNKQTVGIVSEVKTDGNGNATKVKVIEGDCDGEVKENTYAADSAEIVGYGLVNEAYGDVVGSGDTAETDVSPMAGANAFFALPAPVAEDDAAGDASDGSNNSSHDFAEDITNVTVSRLENGQWVPGTEFTDGDSVRMEIHYTIPEGRVGVNNKTIHYQLPDGIRLSQQEQGTVYDGQRPVGTYTITTDGKITIVFNDNYANDQSFTGHIQFQGTVSAQQGQEETKINFGAGGTITVKPNPDLTDVRADKSGFYNEQDGKLHYTIQVTTTKGTNGTITVTDSFQSGNTSATYDTDSFQIVKVDVSGQKTAINSYTPVITSGDWDGAPQHFTITGLPALNPNESYYITYTATPGTTSNINGYSDVSNYVTTTTEGGNSGSDWNQVVISQNMINKWGNYDSASGVINWTITINPDKRDIGGYTLSDTITTSEGITAKLPENITLTGSDGSTQTITLPYIFPAGSKDAYTITYQTKVEGLNPGEKASVTNDAHLTHEDDDYKAESTVWPQGQDFSSSKSYGWHDGSQDTGSTGTYQWNASITVPSSVGDEELGNLTFNDTIRDLVAADGSEVGGSHYITAQQLGAMSVNINGVPLERGTDYQICDANGTAITELTGDTTYTGFQIQFTEAALKKIKGQTISLQYYTTVDYTKLADGASYTICNTGGIPGHETTPETGYHKPGQLEKQAKGSDQWGNETWLDNGASLDFEASQGVIHYRLLLHTSDDTKGDLTVKDILPSGASLVEKSAYMRFYYNGYETEKIEWQDNGQQTYYADQNLTVVSETSDETTTLTFTIKDGYNGNGANNTLAIYYDVSIAKDPIWTDDPGLEEHLYTNRASWGDNEANTDVTVERDVPKLEKTGAQLPQYDENGNPITDNEGNNTMSNTVRYNVTINPAAQNLDPNADVLQLVDTFGNLPSGVVGADLSIGSVKLYLYDADKADHLGSELSNARYSYTYDSEGRILTFTIPDSMGLVLVYDYTIDRGTAAGELTLSNSVELTGVAGSKTEDETKLEETSSSATATKRTLTIYKVDGTNYGRALPGAEFELEQFETESRSWQHLEVFTTDKNGAIVLSRADDEKYPNFNFIDDTLYRLTETEAPGGYAKDDTPYYFVWLGSGSTEQDMAETISAAGTNKDNVLFINDSSAIYVPNEPTTLKVQKVWTDQDGNETDPGAESVQVQLYQQAMQTNAVTVTVDWTDNANNSTRGSVEVAEGSSLTIHTGTYVNLTYSINGGSSQTVTNNEPIHLDNITENTTILMTGPDYNYPNFTFSDYTEPYFVPSGEKKPYGEAVTLNAGNYWSHTWGEDENLPRADEKGNPYYYTVEETEVPGYSVIYSSNNQNGIQTGQLVITNRASGYILPETGGTGTLLYTTGGLALIALAGLMYKIILRRRGEVP
mgnify:CR=1 FL=1